MKFAHRWTDTEGLELIFAQKRFPMKLFLYILFYFGGRGQKHDFEKSFHVIVARYHMFKVTASQTPPPNHCCSGLFVRHFNLASCTTHLQARESFSPDLFHKVSVKTHRAASTLISTLVCCVATTLISALVCYGHDSDKCPCLLCGYDIYKHHCLLCGYDTDKHPCLLCGHNADKHPCCVATMLISTLVVWPRR